MGQSLEDCMKGLDGHHSGHEVHLLERIDMKFLAENCIVPKAPNLTRFKISGQLPNLQVNFSDARYKQLMRMIDVAIPKFGNGDKEKAAAAGAEHHKEIQSRPDLYTRDSSSRYPDADEDLVLDHEVPKGQGEDEGKKEDEFYEAQDMTESGVNIHQKTFEFSFSVDTLRASIFKSNPDPSKPEKLLVNTVLEGFGFEFALRPFDMSVDIVLKSLYVEDKMVEDQTVFRHLVTSEDPEKHEKSGRDLVTVKYSRVQAESPEFMTVHESINQVSTSSSFVRPVWSVQSPILCLFPKVRECGTLDDQYHIHSCQHSELVSLQPLNSLRTLTSGVLLSLACSFFFTTG